VSQQWREASIPMLLNSTKVQIVLHESAGSSSGIDNKSRGQMRFYGVGQQLTTPGRLANNDPRTDVLRAICSSTALFGTT